MQLLAYLFRQDKETNSEVLCKQLQNGKLWEQGQVFAQPHFMWSSYQSARGKQVCLSFGDARLCFFMCLWFPIFLGNKYFNVVRLKS